MFPHSSSFRRERWTQALRRDKPLIFKIYDDLVSEARIISKLLGTEDYEIVAAPGPGINTLVHNQIR